MSGTKGAPVIEVKDLNISFRTAAGVIKVVENVSFSIGKGECLAVVGESGSGKSVSALATIGLLVKDQSIVTGSVIFRGEELLGKPESYMRKVRGGGISMIFQEPLSALNPVTTIGEQIAEVLVAHGRAGWREANKKAIEYLELVEIAQAPQRVKQYPHQLSGGMRQRAMIAMALAGEPELIIADEPTTALDVTIQAQVLELLAGLKRESGLAMIFITHSLPLVAEIADRVVVMYAGEIVEEGSVAEVFARPLHPYTAALIASAPSEGGSAPQGVPGTVPQPHALPPGCRFAPRCAHRLDACEQAPPPFVTPAAGRGTRCIRWTLL